jgi:hypothetical protein
LPKPSYLLAVRPAVERLLRESTLTTLVFAIAIGWSLYQAASGLGYLITNAFQKVDTDGTFGQYLGTLTWTFHGHIFAFAPLIQA